MSLNLHRCWGGDRPKNQGRIFLNRRVQYWIGPARRTRLPPCEVFGRPKPGNPSHLFWKSMMWKLRWRPISRRGRADRSEAEAGHIIQRSPSFPQIFKWCFSSNFANFQKVIKSSVWMEPTHLPHHWSGHFGSRAAEKLFQKDFRSKIIVVDKSKKALQKISRLPIETIISDGIFYLSHFYQRVGKQLHHPCGSPPPCFEFILSQLNLWVQKEIEFLPSRDYQTPWVVRQETSIPVLLIFSALKIVPEPAQYCTLTKKRRPKPLYSILNDFGRAFESRVIRSQQLGPGIGGFQPRALLNVLEEIKKKMHPGQTILVSTASRCTVSPLPYRSDKPIHISIWSTIKGILCVPKLKILTV